MAPYWYVSGFLLVISLVELLLKKDERTNHLLTYLLCIATVTLIVFGGIRGLGIGMDDYQYRNFFEDFIRRIQVNGIFNTVAFFRYEPLIFAIATLTSLISHNASTFLFVFSILAVGTNAIFFKKMSPYPVMALALYSAHIFINKDMNQIRFGLSSALFLGVIWALYLKCYWLATGFFVLSFLSHNTAVMVVTLLPFLLMRERRWWPIAIIVLSIPASKVGGMGFVSVIAGHLGALGERAANYNNDNSAAATTGSVFSVSNLKNAALIFIFVYFMLSNQLKRDNYDAWRLNYLLIITFAIGGGIRIFFYNYLSGARLSKKPAMFVFFQMYYLYYNTISLKQAVVGYEVASEFRLVH